MLFYGDFCLEDYLNVYLQNSSSFKWSKQSLIGSFKTAKKNWCFSDPISNRFHHFYTQQDYADVSKLKEIGNQILQLAHSTCMMLFLQKQTQKAWHIGIIKNWPCSFLKKAEKNLLSVFQIFSIYYFRNLTFWDSSPHFKMIPPTTPPFLPSKIFNPLLFCNFWSERCLTW